MSDQVQHKAVHIIVRGLVQGVGFRYFVLRRAQPLGLTGWVRNLPNGTVEIHAEGPESRLQQLLDLVASGPSGARVTEVEHFWTTATGAFTDFQVRF